jgi:predicted RNA binding protein YcfA (HicA-like mRNA interferase family)
MPELPVISGRECIQALERAGYHQARTKGSHVRLRCPGRSPITVPLHRELDRGTLRHIISEASLSVAEFVELLKK